MVVSSSLHTPRNPSVVSEPEPSLPELRFGQADWHLEPCTHPSRQRERVASLNVPIRIYKYGMLHKIVRL